MNEFESIFRNTLRNSEYISKSKQWEKILRELQHLKYNKDKIAKAKSYFESTYYPAKLAQFHTPEALFKKFWNGDLEANTISLTQNDVELKTKLYSNGFSRDVEIKMVEYRRKLTSQIYDGYRQKIKQTWVGLNEDAKKIAAIVYGEVSKTNKPEPTEEMRLVASLLRNRVERVNKLKNESQAPNASKQAKAKYKQVVSDFGNDNYQSIISHFNQFGSYNGPLYNSMMNSKFPDDVKALKTAIGSIRAANEIYNKGVPPAYVRVMYMRTAYDTQAPAHDLEATFIREGGNNFWKIKP